MLPTLSVVDRAELQFCDEGTCGHCDHYAIRVAALLERHVARAIADELDAHHRQFKEKTS